MPIDIEESQNESCLLDGKQTAKKLYVCDTTFGRWKKAGLIPYITVGGVVRYHWPSVLKALRAYESRLEPQRSTSKPSQSEEVSLS
jgi:hypothetical protein